MSLLSPWSALWLLSLPILVAFYLFRPEPQKRLSTAFFLWKRSVPESQGGVYAKQLRSNPLLWLQLLILLLLALYLMKPATSWQSTLPVGSKIVLVVDTSASMSAGNAFEQAQERASEAVDGLFGLTNLGSHPEVMLIAVDREPRILVPFTRESAPLRSALDSLKVSQVPDRLETLRPFLANLISDRKASVMLYSDHLPAELELPGLQFAHCGTKPTSNVAISAFSVEASRQTGSVKPLLYARVENFSGGPEQRLLRIESLNGDNPERSDGVVHEQLLTLPAGEGRTVSLNLPATRLSATRPTLFRARISPPPGSPPDGFAADDLAYSCSPAFGGERITVAVTGELKAGFLLQALMAHPKVEVMDWKTAVSQPTDRPLDVLISSRNFRPPSRPAVRTRMLVTEAEPAKGSTVETLTAVPGQALVADAGVAWERLRVQRDAAWPVEASEQVLLKTASGPALTLSGTQRGQPTLCWRFPLGYSSLPLSPALPILTGRFLSEYAQPVLAALPGSWSTEERRTRPAGRSWSGRLEFTPKAGSALEGPKNLVSEAGDPYLPRLTLSGLYQVVSSDTTRPWVAVNMVSARESALPWTDSDRSFSKEEAGAAQPGPSQQHYREMTAPLAALGLALLFLEAAVFLRRRRP